jgi:hypothetical protein
MTINEVISQIKGLLDAYSDDSDFKAPYLWGLFCLCRAEILGQSLEKQKFVGGQHYKTVCIELEESKFYECNCLDLDCTVFKSKNKLPNTIKGRNKDTLKVFPLLSRKPIPYIKDTELDVYLQDDIYTNKPMYSIVNNHLVLFNKNYPKVHISGIWEDNLKLNDIQYCSNTDDCIDFFKEDIGMDKKEVSNAIKKLFREYFNIDIQLPPDVTNDINETIVL